MVTEQKLTRIATVVHEAYLKFRENTWDTPINKDEGEKKTLIIHKDNRALKENYFLGFPKKLFKNEQAKMAALCLFACNEPLAWMHQLLCALIQYKG